MINPQVFEKAYLTSKDFPGMGSLKIWECPYTGEWTVEISFADDTRYVKKNTELDQALLECSQEVYDHPPDSAYYNGILYGGEKTNEY